MKELSQPTERATEDWPQKYDLFGLQVSAVEYDQAVTCIMSAANKREAAVVSCHAVHAVVTLSSDQSLCEAANRFEMITPDGQPVRWALNALYQAGLRERVYGPELMWRVLRECEQQGVSVYFYGGSEETSTKLRSNMQEAFPMLKIAGASAPPFRTLDADELEAVAKEINECAPAIVFIGLGCPKQDRFAAAQAGRIKAVQVCVGAAFDFHAKVKPMAPVWMQRHGLEWLFRLSCEPRRLFRRYLTTNTVFVYRCLKARLSKAS